MNTRFSDVSLLNRRQHDEFAQWANRAKAATKLAVTDYGVVAVELHRSALTASCGIGPFPVALKLRRYDDMALLWETVYVDCPPCWPIDDRMVVEL